MRPFGNSPLIRRITIMSASMSIVLILAAVAAARVYVVNRSHPACSDKNSGTEEAPFATISRGAELAQPGDTVLVQAGTYRERVSPARGGTETQPIEYRAAAGEQVVIKGSDVWRPNWEPQNRGATIYTAKLDSVLFQGLRIHPYRERLKQAPAGQTLTLGQLFMDGQLLTEVTDGDRLEATPGTWRAVDHGNELQVHLPQSVTSPAHALVELTVRERIFAPKRRGLGYIHVIGFTMEHCANQFPDRFWESDSPQAGALGCRAGHHWRIENNTIRWAKSIGLDCGYEGRVDLEGNQPSPQNSGHHRIRNNRVTDNGCCGIAGMRSIGSSIVGNIIERNNRLQHSAPEIGGIKLHYFLDGRIEGNLIRDNEAHGIWIDNTYRRASVHGNLVLNNRGNGIFVELGQGPILIDHNIIGDTQLGYHPRDPRGDGMYSHDASGITFAHNLVFGSHRFGAFHTKATSRRGAAASQLTWVNNLFIENTQGHLNLPWPAEFAQGNRSDRQLFSAGLEFLVHPWGGIAPAELTARVERQLGRPPERWSNAACRMRFAEWQQLTKWDVDSREGVDLQVHYSGADEVHLELRNFPEIPSAEPVAQVTVDYFGQPLPAQGAVIGPFQDVKRRSSFVVWPR